MSLFQKSLFQTSGYTVLKMVQRGASLGTQIILARYLLPDAFGVVMLGISLLIGHKILTQWGTSVAVVQTDREETVRTIFTVEALFSACLLVLTFGMGAALWRMYEYPVVFVFLMMGIGTSFDTFTTVYKAVLQKELQLNVIGSIEAISSVASGILAILLAMTGWGFVSLLAYYFLRKFLNRIAVMQMSPFTASFGWSRRSLQWFFHFNKYVFGASSIDTIELKGDDFLVGNIAGTASLGFYSISWRLARFFNNVIMSPINQVILPSVSEIQADPEKLRKGYAFMIRCLVLPCIPLFALLFIYAHELITFTFGQKWTPAVRIFRFQIVFAFLTPVFSANKHVLLGLGKTKSYFHTKLVMLICFVLTMIPLTLFYEALGAALSMNVTYLIGVCTILYYIKQAVDVELRQMVIRTLISLIGPVAICWAFFYLVPLKSMVFQKILVSAILVFSYAVIVFLMYGGEIWSDVRRILRALND